jgi:D-methionine transport system ATP-binding protein
MIELKGLSKTYVTQGESLIALKNIDLKVKKGEIYGVMGPSGAGKSTLIRCVNLLEAPTAGQVKIDGLELTTLSAPQLRAERRKIGMIFQGFNLLSSRTVAENIAFPLELLGLAKKDITKRVDELTELTGLSARKQAYPQELSGGQKQRVAIARALANRPKVLLSDEATSALDPETTVSILELLRSINQELKLTILLITHEMDVIKRICDHACILDQGEIVEAAPVIDLFSHPKTPLAKRFVLSSLNVEVPDALQKMLKKEPAEADSVPIVRLTFLGKKAGEPVMATLMAQFKVTANILQAHLNWVHHSSIGVSICELLGERDAIVAGIQFIQAQGVEVEILGYVSRSATFTG